MKHKSVPGDIKRNPWRLPLNLERSLLKIEDIESLTGLQKNICDWLENEMRFWAMITEYPNTKVFHMYFHNLSDPSVFIKLFNEFNIQSNQACLINAVLDELYFEDDLITTKKKNNKKKKHKHRNKDKTKDKKDKHKKNKEKRKNKDKRKNKSKSKTKAKDKLKDKKKKRIRKRVRKEKKQSLPIESSELLDHSLPIEASIEPLPIAQEPLIETNPIIYEFNDISDYQEAVDLLPILKANNIPIDVFRHPYYQEYQFIKEMIQFYDQVPPSN
jgi:hypothetical protein